MPRVLDRLILEPPLSCPDQQESLKGPAGKVKVELSYFNERGNLDSRPWSFDISVSIPLIFFSFVIMRVMTMSAMSAMLMIVPNGMLMSVRAGWGRRIDKYTFAHTWNLDCGAHSDLS